jgi:hypothetical protein
LEVGRKPRGRLPGIRKDEDLPTPEWGQSRRRNSAGGLHLDLLCDQRLKRLVTFCLVVLNGGPTKGGALAADRTRPKLTRSGVCEIVVGCGRAQSVAAQVNLAISRSRFCGVQPTRDQVVLSRLDGITKNGTLKQEIYRRELIDLAQERPKSAARLRP